MLEECQVDVGVRGGDVGVMGGDVSDEGRFDLRFYLNWDG